MSERFRRYGIATTALAAMVLAACSGTSPKVAEPEPPEPTPEEQLRGSWSITVPWVSDGTELGIEHHVLTFTKSRWIQNRARLAGDNQDENAATIKVRMRE